MVESLTIDFGKPFPLFPLPDCVLLPHATVPLRIFEPRYRAMTRDALNSRGLIAMATFEGDHWKHDYNQKPPIRAHVCVGTIVRHERLPDGKYHILLQGVCRARVIKELEHDPYRIGTLTPTETQAPMEIDLEERRRRLEQLLGDSLLQQLRCVGVILNLLNREISTAALVNLAILATSASVDQRYEMLAQSDAQARAAWLEGHLRHTRHTLLIADRLGAAVSDEGLNLN